MSDTHSSHLDCPVKGCRAPDFAAGDVEVALDNMFATTEIDVMQQSTELVAGGDLSTVVSDWNNAKHCVQLELQQKLQFWKLLL